MKIFVVLSFVQILGAAASTTASPQTSTPEVLVCLDRIAQASTSTAYVAQSEASKLLARAAVHVAWIHGSACNNGNAIQVHLTVQTPDYLLPGALAFCQPTARDDIRIFYDRIQSTVSRAHEPHLFAYVLAHEIVHILEGEGRHSLTGIMKAQWSVEDYAAMASGKLSFASEDIELVCEGLSDRQARQNAPARDLLTEAIR